MIAGSELPDFIEVRDKTQKVLGSEWNFKTFKGVYLKIMKVLQNPTSSAKDLSKIIAEDQGLSTRTLQIINSAYFGLRNHVTDLTQAIALIGFEMLKRVAFNVAVFEAFPARSKLSLIRLWRNALGVAKMSELLAKELRHLPGEAYTVGLLHHIGKYLVCSLNEDKYFQTLLYKKNNGCSDLEAEIQVLGVSHSEIGYAVAKHWQLPDMIAESIARHHAKFTEDQKKLPHAHYLAQVVSLADAICAHLGLGTEDTPIYVRPADIIRRIPLEDYRNLYFEREALFNVIGEGESLMKEIDQLLELLHF